MTAIMTVIGPDRVGIVAAVSNLLASLNINILDINQTIMGGIFTMTLYVDIKEANRPFEEINSTMTVFGEKENLSVRIQRAEIFTAMHRI